MARVLLLYFLAFVPPCPVPQSSGLQEAVRAEELEEKFYALLRLYENAFEGYQFEVREAQRLGKPEEERPQHPSSLFYDRFLALSEQGSPWGMAWLLENVQYRHPELAEQVAHSKLWYERLIHGWPDHDSLLRATRLLPSAAKALGRDYVLELLAQLFEATTRRDLKGNTLWALGTTMQSGESSMSEEDARSALAFFEQLVQTYPEAPLASDAALTLFPVYQDEFLRSLTDWVEALERDFAGASNCPVDAFVERMAPLARTGILQARQWTGEFHRRWNQAGNAAGSGDETAPSGQQLLALADQCSFAQGALRGPWIDLMLRLRSLVVTHWGGADWVRSDLERFVTECFYKPYSAATLAPFIEVLAGAAKTKEERADAEFGRALVLARREKLEDLVHARDAYQRLLDDDVERSWEPLALREVESLTGSLPGSRLELKGRGPDGQLLDVAQFRGSVVLVDFFSFNNERCDERLRREAEQLRLWQDKPVVVLGVCFESLVTASFRMKAVEHGLDWPCISDLTVRGQFASNWHVRQFPTAFVLDREGVIVTRNRSWPAIVETIERLFEN